MFWTCVSRWDARCRAGCRCRRAFDKARPNGSTRPCNAGSELVHRPPAPAELQHQLDSSASTTTNSAHTARCTAEPRRRLPRHPKAAPATNGHAQGHYRLRYDRLDTKGNMTLRRAGRMHHLGVGTTHARKRVLALADDTTSPSPNSTPAKSSPPTSSSPTRAYWRNQHKKPGRWPSSPN